MPTYKLNYFPITALGEPIRATFALAGIPFEDDKVPGDRWQELKPTLPAGSQMPILHVTEGAETQLMFQSRAILRYVGSIGTYEGAKLYPDEPMERYYCDEVIEMVEDIRPHLLPTFAIEDQAQKEAARLALVRPEGKMYAPLMKLNDRLGKFPFAAGDRPTVADAYVVFVVFLFQQPSFLDGFPEDSLKDMPNITGLKDRFCGLPPLVAYYKDAEGIRAPFKVAPNAKAVSKKEAKPKDGKAKDPAAAEKEKLLKKVVKEGGKRGVEIEGAADMGGLQFFCTSVDEPQGDIDLLIESLNAMNADAIPGEEERKGCSGHIGKTIFSCGTEQLAVIAYVPEDKLDVLSCEEWLKSTLALFQGEVVKADKQICVGRVKADSNKGVFPLKIREPMILEANNFLRKKGLFPDNDDDDDDEMVFGDDDFPS